MAISVRRANPPNIDWLLKQLKCFLDFFDSKAKLYGDEEPCRNDVLNMIENHFVFVSECSTCGPVGFIAVLLVNHMFNHTIRVLSETFWWVAKETRHTGAGRAFRCIDDSRLCESQGRGSRKDAGLNG